MCEAWQTFSEGSFRVWQCQCCGWEHGDPPKPTDPIVERVREKLLARAGAGLRKYGKTMMRDDLTLVDWLHHAQEEAMDLCVYLERAIHDCAQWMDDGR